MPAGQVTLRVDRFTEGRSVVRGERQRRVVRLLLDVVRAAEPRAVQPVLGSLLIAAAAELALVVGPLADRVVGCPRGVPHPRQRVGRILEVGVEVVQRLAAIALL